MGVFTQMNERFSDRLGVHNSNKNFTANIKRNSILLANGFLGRK